MIILDTQHVSQLLRVGSRDAVVLETRLSDVSRSESWITVVTPYEQIRGAIAVIGSTRSAADRVVPFDFLLRLLDHYASRWPKRILPFDQRAVTFFQGFEPKLIRRIGSRDAMIAAIALAHGATLLTANTSDFRQVPGLIVEDWLRDGEDPITPST